MQAANALNEDGKLREREREREKWAGRNSQLARSMRAPKYLCMYTRMYALCAAL